MAGCNADGFAKRLSDGERKKLLQEPAAARAVTGCCIVNLQ